MEIFYPTPSAVFPTTKSGAMNKLITEGNLTKLINALLDTDTYIIPPMSDFVYEETTGDDFDNIGTLVSIPGTVANSHLELMLNGYYFDIGTIQSIITDAGTAKKISAKIIVDTSVPEYPELYGETYETNTGTVTLESAFVSGTTTLDENYRGQSVVSISVDDTNGNTYAVTLDTTTYVMTVPDVTGVTFKSEYTVEYIDYYNVIKLYALDADESVPEESGDSLPTHEEYTIDLFYKYNNNWYFPLKSFVKFLSPSIGSIDGGII